MTSKKIAELHEQNLLLFEPDGKRLAWFDADTGIGDFGRHLGSKGPNDELFLWDPKIGHRWIYEGRIVILPGSSINSSTPFVVWASESELKPSANFKDLKILKEVTAKNRAVRKDTRPHVKDCLEIDIKTDRETYQRHAPVVLTISVKNLTDTNYRFEKRSVTETSMPFSLENKNKSGRNEIHLFDREQNVLDTDFLDLPPGETVEFRRTLDVKKIGEQRFELRVACWGIWQGSLIAKTHFEVLEETTPELLKQKFDRVLGACLKRWERTKGSNAGIGSTGFWQLGDEGAELLVEYLNDCNDDRLRDKLTDGLRPTLVDPAMIYFEGRLATDLEHDSSSVVQCLSSMVGRARWKRDKDKFEKSRKLLLAAGKHSNPKAKFAATRNMYGSLPEDADQFMLAAVEDANDTVATYAAKYIAVRQQLPLKEWLEYARNHPSRATKLASISFGKKIADKWDHELDPEEIVSGLERNFEQTIGKLIDWCDRHPRIAAEFLDEVSSFTFGERSLLQKHNRKPIVLSIEG